MSWARHVELISYLIDLMLHLDKHLVQLTAQFGGWTYLILFLIIFAETGLVFTPFLPGDSLLFAAGAISGLEGGALNPHLTFVLLTIAAILGDTVNYWIGKYAGPLLLRGGKSRWLKQSHLDKTHQFFERYGGKTIIIARFVPIVRTFAPFVAGLGAMTYPKFVFYNIVGGVAWVAICLYAGVLFGKVPFVEKNFSLVVLAIIVISVLPGVYEFFKVRAEMRRARRAEQAAAAPPAQVDQPAARV